MVVTNTFMPSMFGDQQLFFKEKEHVLVEFDKHEFHRKIQETVKQQSDSGRPVLVF